jgi:hypothetical protein|tara:strand:+ start:1441 stop:1905 length:465 start_codon:yes stop_codon:yes gene_type:complete
MSLDTLEWSQIDSIQMSVQTADLSVLNNTTDQQLSLSCTLLTIARGKCNVEIQHYKNSAEEALQDASYDGFSGGFSGGVIIPRDRPVMQCKGVMPASHFNALTEKFIAIRSVGRPITVTLYLQDKLSVSVNGDLYIEDTREITIKHIDFIFPLR